MRIVLSGILFFMGFSALTASAQDITTLDATDVNAVSAIVNGNTSSQAAKVSFVWGTDTNYGNITNIQYVNTNTFSAQLTNLRPETTYHYRAVLYNNILNIPIALGEDKTFITGAMFNDANLKAKVEETLGITNPTPSEMLNLTELWATDSDITDLSGLEYAGNLTGLSLPSNSISDITLLKNLTSLEYLDLSYNTISDIIPLANMNSLTRLYLGNNDISDIIPLVNMNSLTTLSLSYNSISDITPLKNLTSLEYLDLRYNTISDIIPLANMNSLTRLYLGNNDISDITLLANMNSLISLNLDSNSISDITPLANMTSMEYLSLGHISISDITLLANMNSLTRLYLNNNSISDISPLSNLSSLETLDLTNNIVSDISSLANMNSLTILNLSSNSIRDITQLTNMTGLKYLYLYRNPLNLESYFLQLDIIKANNPDINLRYDNFSGGVTIINPNGSEVMLGGRQQLLSWSSSMLDYIDIYYSLDNGESWVLITQMLSPDGTNRFIWEIPQLNESSTQCLIRMDSPWSESINDVSAAFTIIPCSITMEDGDLNNDCQIDLGDFAILAGNWLRN